MTKVILLAAAVLGACDVGALPNTAQNTVDAPPGSVIVDAPTQLNCATRVAPAPLAHKHAQSGTSNQGQGCVEANCHSNANPGQGAPGFQFAGTVFGITSPTVGNAGATVTFVPANGIAVTAITDTDGNFFYPPPVGNATGTLIPNPFPMHTSMSVCPSGPTPMSAAITQGGGDCSGGGTCHGGSQGPVKLDPTI